MFHFHLPAEIVLQAKFMWLFALYWRSVSGQQLPC